MKKRVVIRSAVYIIRGLRRRAVDSETILPVDVDPPLQSTSIHSGSYLVVSELEEEVVMKKRVNSENPVTHSTTNSKPCDKY